MKTPQPWRSTPPADPDAARLAPLLDAASHVKDQTATGYARTFERIEETPRRQRRVRAPWHLGLAFALGAAAILLLIKIPDAPLPEAQQTTWRTVEVAGLGTIEVTEQTELRLQAAPLATDDERRVYVVAGTARAQLPPRQQPAVLVTPHLRIVVAGARYSTAVTVEVTDISLVKVEAGRARVESSLGGAVPLTAGEGIDSRDPRLSVMPAAQPTPTPQTSKAAHRKRSDARRASDCRRKPSIPERRQCLVRIGTGDGLPAQNALYALGLLEKEAGDIDDALRAWHRYQRRFPEGLLGPEVGVAMVQGLLAANRYAEAFAASQSYALRFAADTRAPEVALIRAKLACHRFGRLHDAKPAFAIAVTSRQPAVREEAAFARAVCLDLLLSRPEAKAAWQYYLHEFPEGHHSQEARDRIEP